MPISTRANPLADSGQHARRARRRRLALESVGEFGCECAGRPGLAKFSSGLTAGGTDLMKTTMELPDELYRHVKKRAADDGTSIKAIVEKALRLYLGGQTKSEYRFSWHPDSGTLLPGVDLDDRDSLFNAMERS